MKYVVVFIGLCLAVVNSMPLEVAEDEDGEQYYMVPLSRTRRSPQSQTGVSANQQGVTLSHGGNILDRNGHTLDGSAYASKGYHSPGLRPDAFGGQLNYNHEPSRTSGYLGADHVRGFGTDARAGVQHDFYRNKNFNVGAGVGAERHYGGPYGNGPTQLGGFIRATGRF
ncbi:unnamed protein product [Acanthoscelides obtectus]|uniref:Attacin C-terminal domain-containing protein n=1 Tax=Acanthoscelides obtectus TaxID=200917 RepID=A0A9P0LDA0_ACAOB|nr:unnamed protein product [Acanthoscelides obtectus]CAK1638991.1 hypothetical protein AOBTE_LOCUS10924 [Acanthoscelides obtectus]